MSRDPGGDFAKPRVDQTADDGREQTPDGREVVAIEGPGDGKTEHLGCADPSDSRIAADKEWGADDNNIYGQRPRQYAQRIAVGKALIGNADGKSLRNHDGCRIESDGRPRDTQTSQ